MTGLTPCAHGYLFCILTSAVSYVPQAGLKKVLIIDDEEDIRRIAHIALTRLGGMEVFEAAGGDEGVRLAEKAKPDVILLDMMMPGVDGAATLGLLRRNAATADIPVIFLTARAQSTDAATIQQMGARGLLSKPFDPTTLALDLRAILRRPVARSQEK